MELSRSIAMQKKKIIPGLTRILSIYTSVRLNDIYMVFRRVPFATWTLNLLNCYHFSSYSFDSHAKALKAYASIPTCIVG